MADVTRIVTGIIAETLAENGDDAPQVKRSGGKLNTPALQYRKAVMTITATEKKCYGAVVKRFR